MMPSLFHNEAGLLLVDFPFTNEGGAGPSGDILGWTIQDRRMSSAAELKLELNYTPHI